MNRWKIGCIAAVVFTVTLLAVVWLLRDGEPVYKGRTLSEWHAIYLVNEDRGSPQNNALAEEAAEAINATVPSCFPWLLKCIEYEERYPDHKVRLSQFLKSIPRIGRPLIKWLHKREVQSGQAMLIFRVLGPRAAPAVPELKKIAQTTSSDTVRGKTIAALTAIGDPSLPAVQELLMEPRTRQWTLGSLGDQHWANQFTAKAEVLLPQLRELSTNEEVLIAESSLYAIATLPVREEFSIPILSNGLLSAKAPVRIAAAQGLAQRGAEAHLLLALSNADPNVRLAASNALRELRRPPDERTFE